MLYQNETITKKIEIMEATMKLAIETYSELTNRATEDIINEVLSGNETITETIMMLMFSVA